MTKIQIFVAMHKNAVYPSIPDILCPIQVGASLCEDDDRIPGILHDDEGDNISEKNPLYSELTAQYFAFKNSDADYIGLFHYCRYLAFKEPCKEEDGWGNLIYEECDDYACTKLGLDNEIIHTVVSGTDIVTVKPRRFLYPEYGRTPKTVREAYGLPPFQHIEDLDTALTVLHEKYPEYDRAAEEYLSSKESYDCNLFVMRRDIFLDYSKWLFDILFETEKRIDTSMYDEQSSRVMGYLGERLFGIYYLKHKKELKTKELPKAMFMHTEPKVSIEPVFDHAVPVVFSVNDRFVPYLDVTIRSLLKNASSKRKYDIIILHSKISDKRKRLLKGIAKGISNVSIRFVDVRPWIRNYAFFTDQHLSEETYYRLILLELLPRYEKILYLDSDLVLEEDVSILFDTDIGESLVGAVRDIDVNGQAGLKMKDWDRYAAKKLGLRSIYDYFQAGVLIMNLSALRKHISTEEILTLAAGRKWRCHDQDVLNRICRGRVHYLPQIWNVLMDWEEPKEGRSRMEIFSHAPLTLFNEYAKARNMPKIVHYSGYQKPWDVADCDMAEYFWKYAKESPYYPSILHNVNRVLFDETEEEKGEGRSKDEPLRWKIVRSLFPVGTRRREVAKRIWHRIRRR